MANRNEKARGAHVDRTAERAREEKRARLAAEKRRAESTRLREQEAKEAARAKKARIARKKRKKALRSLKITLIVLLVLALVIAGALIYAAIRLSESETNLPNVFLNGIDVGGLTQSETLARLNEAGWDEAAAVPMTVELPRGVRFELDRREAGVALTAEAAAKAAYRYGHTEDKFGNLMCYVNNIRNRTDIALEYPRMNTEYVEAQTDAAVAQFHALAAAGSREPVVDLEHAEIRTVKGSGELYLNTGAVLTQLAQALRDGKTSFVYDQIDGVPTMPDFDALYRELNVEPQNAYFANENFDVVDEVVGCSFDAEAAKELWNRADLLEEVIIPVVITEPEVTGDSLRSLLFRDVLGFQTTIFASSGENRINNIKLAASKINGVVLMPGEEFSYNGTIGQRTKEAGFLEAGAYADGEVVQEVGGGICQVSSTLYCATLFANLETVSRTNHYFRVDYLPIAYDATVSWPSPDFKFRNNRQYPIKIVAYTDEDKSLTVEIHGTNVDGSYVELTNSQYVVYDSTYTNVIIGWGAQAFRHVYNAEGVEIEVIQEPYGIYNKHSEDIEWPPEYYAAQQASEEGGESDAEIIYG